MRAQVALDGLRIHVTLPEPKARLVVQVFFFFCGGVGGLGELTASDSWGGDLRTRQINQSR